MKRTTWPGEPLARLRHPGAEDGELALRVRERHPRVEATAPERVGEVAGAVRGEDDVGDALRPDRAELRHRHLEVREHLQQVRLELLVGAVDLVDEEHRGLVLGDRLEKRPAQEIAFGEDPLLGLVRALLVLTGPLMARSWRW